MKDLLLHLNVSKHCRMRVEVAVRLAKAFGGHLTGLSTSPAGNVPLYMLQEATTSDEATMHALWLQARDKVRAEFEEVLRNTDIATSWVEIEDKDGGAVAQYARYADLTIVGQLDPDEPLPRREYKVPELVALDSGGPVLVAPYAGTFDRLGRRALIALNKSVQSARAVRDALPLLVRAEAVIVLAINPERSGTEKHGQPRARIATYLA
jgi:hypothetical protein